MSKGLQSDPGWEDFMAKLEAAEQEFAEGRPAAFKALWSHAEDVTICGAFGNIEAGWDKVSTRLDWASSKFSAGDRSRREVSRMVGSEVAHLVQKELIQYRIPGRDEPATLEMRATMVFRKEAGEWRIVHRHADSQIKTEPPR